MRVKKQKAIICAGNLCDGFTFYGPFETFDDAVEWGDTHQKELPGLGEYWVATLEEANA